jgi:hypothetical protein
MFSPEVEKALLTGEWTEETAAEWDADDDPIIAEVRRARQEIMAEVRADFGNDWERYNKHLLVKGYARGAKYVSSDWRDPHGPREPGPPADLTGLIPNREDFIRYVRLSRGVTASHEPDLEAYNEDGRRRALVLGFPPESFVVSKDDFPVDWQAMMREAEVELAKLPPGVTELPEEVKDALYARALARRDLANRS